MASPPPSIFITGITGKQGSALAKHLLALHWTVHSTVRSLSSPTAHILVNLGANLIQGDWENEVALRTGISGCSKLYLNLVSTFDDYEREWRQAVRICEIAKEEGVRQVVCATSLGVSLLESSKPHLANLLEPGSLLHTLILIKQKIEQIVLHTGFPSVTFLRPSYFMANFLIPAIDEYTEIIDKGTWSTVLKQDTKLGLIDHEDIARIAVEILKEGEGNGDGEGGDSGKWNKRKLGLVSEFLTTQEILDRLGEAMGRDGMKALFLEDGKGEGKGERGFENPYVKGDKCLEVTEELVDMQELRGIVELTSFKTFLERERDRVKRL